MSQGTGAGIGQLCWAWKERGLKPPRWPVTSTGCNTRHGGLVPGHVRLFASPWIIAPQDPLIGFSRQEYWSGLPFPSKGNLPNQGSSPGLLHCRQIPYCLSPHTMRWEGGSGWGTHVNPWLIHVNVWQKPLQYCKVISLQLIKINGKKMNFRWKKMWLNSNKRSRKWIEELIALVIFFL